MSDPLDVLWDRADAESLEISGDDFHGWPPAFTRRLESAGLIGKLPSSTSVVCDACAESHAEEIIQLQEPAGTSVRFYIGCPEHGRVEVPPYRLERWTIDFQRLARAVAASLDLAGELEEVVQGRVWALGKATFANRLSEVFLVRGATWRDSGRVIGGCTRLNAAANGLVLLPGSVPRIESLCGPEHSVVELRAVSAIADGRIVIDRESLDQIHSKARKGAAVVHQSSFPTPEGSQWKDIKVTLEHLRMRVEAKGIAREFTFQDAGFENKRSKEVPNHLWYLLNAIAIAGGIRRNDSILPTKTGKNLAQYLSQLRVRLQNLIPNIEDNPIPYCPDERNYQCRFRLVTVDTLQIPTPSGTTWSQISIALIGHKRIRITCPAIEQYSVAGEGGNGDEEWRDAELAEEISESSRELSYEMLHLDDGEGGCDRCGMAFQELLRNGGWIDRPQNDRDMLKLCEILSKLIPLEESPFDYNAGKWVAKFETSDETAAIR